jgi:oxalate decarboxylase/phosphoglucose isomerase-like protein (cupin superfamily)
MVLKDQKQRVNIVLNESQRKYLQQISTERGLSASEIIREMIEEKKKEDQRRRLIEAANSLADEYRRNDELTVFTALDGEDIQ